MMGYKEKKGKRREYGGKEGLEKCGQKKREEERSRRIERKIKIYREK